MSNIQNLLDLECNLSNQICTSKAEHAILINVLSDARNGIHDQIRALRADDETPVCFGHDDCSSQILSMCPWRFDCGT